MISKASRLLTSDLQFDLRDWISAMPLLKSWEEAYEKSVLKYLISLEFGSISDLVFPSCSQHPNGDDKMERKDGQRHLEDLIEIGKQQVHFLITGCRHFSLFSLLCYIYSFFSEQLHFCSCYFQRNGMLYRISSKPKWNLTCVMIMGFFWYRPANAPTNRTNQIEDKKTTLFRVPS